MKVVLLLDKMPFICGMCRFSTRGTHPVCIATDREHFVDIHNCRPSWCPLKETPDDTEELDEQVKRLVNEYLSSIWETMKETMK